MVPDKFVDKFRRSEPTPVGGSRAGFAGLFEAAREASAAAKPDEPVVLLLLEPHNPTAIAANPRGDSTAGRRGPHRPDG